MLFTDKVRVLMSKATSNIARRSLRELTSLDQSAGMRRNGHEHKPVKLKALPTDFVTHNHNVYKLESVAGDSVGKCGLFSAEAHIFAKYQREIATARVLDIGVGGGRTAEYLLTRCRSYQAIDYSPAMIDACRRRFPECAPDTFRVADARDLSEYATGEFDFALFSYNGLDYIGHQDRLRALSEIRRVLRPGGLFCFSTHSLHAFPFAEPRVQARNAHVDINRLRQQGWFNLIDRAADVVTYYVYPDVQKRQLKIAEFAVLQVLDMQAQPFDFSSPPDDWMIHFVCQARATR